MITELCMSTGWSFREVMDMSMITFGMFVGHSRKIEEKRFNRLCFEMCDVVGVSMGGPSYQEALKKVYMERMMTEKQREKLRSPRVFDSADKEQSDRAAMILASALRQKKKLMGL